MSDDMRVYGRSGQEQAGGDPRQRRAEALKRFRGRHSAGDLVQGIFLNLEPASPGTAWVNLEGAALLAALPEDLAALAARISAGQGAGATPTGVTEADFPLKRGQACYFVLEALEPEPVLRMLGHSDASGKKTDLARAASEARWQGILRLPLTQLAARYTQKRGGLEQLLQQSLWTADDLKIPFPKELPDSLTDFTAAAFAEPCGQEPESAQARYSAFIGAGGNPTARQIFDELELYRVALVENLRPYGLLGLFFTPWLCPAARSLELAFLRQRSGESAAPSRASAMQGVTYKLQALFEEAGRQSRRELSGILGGISVLRSPGPEEADLLRQLLALKPEETRTSFSRKA